jgi:hypothetical protein
MMLSLWQRYDGFTGCMSAASDLAYPFGVIALLILPFPQMS